jgi:hypothetical protein
VFDLSGMLITLEQLKDMDLSRFKGDMFREEKAFQNLLCAIFGREYSVTDAAELNAMTTQALGYGALPILSKSISRTFSNSPGLISSIGKDPCSLLVSASKLRHKVLFRECFIHVLGPWSRPRHHQLSEPALRHLAATKTESLNSWVLGAYEGIVGLASGVISDPTLARQFLDLAPYCVFGNEILFPKFLRLCYEYIENNYKDGPIYPPFSRLLANKLALNEDAVAGAGDFADFFLCCELDDDELPWDVTQTDW